MTTLAQPSPPQAERPAADRDALALYVHWPFCLSKCPYCDFNSHIAETVDTARWQRALIAEIDHAAAETGRRHLVSIFFGGGTPSLMAPATVAAVIERAAMRWRTDRDIEITLEANPTSVEAGRFRDYRAAGVNRVSLGVQALDDTALEFLGRRHSAAEARDAVTLAARVFPRYTFDLIYARPGQSRAGWRRELRAAVALAGGHMSAYQLTFEKGTPFFAAFSRGEIVALPEDDAAALYEETADILSGSGLPAYEISNHARAGAESRHNLVYWRGGDYAGIGPGAHGRLTQGGAVIATEQVRAPGSWIAAVESAGSGTRLRETLSDEARRDEIVMMGLRLTRGIERARFRSLTGRGFEHAFDSARLSRLVDAGFLECDEAGLRATAAGRLRLNAVIGALVA